MQCLAFSPDGALLAGALADDSVRLWDVKAGEEVGAIWVSEFQARSFSLGGDLLFTAQGKGKIDAWGLPGPSLFNWL